MGERHIPPGSRRRGFYDVAKGGDAPVATEALARIARLYEIEASIRGQDVAHRVAVRRAESQALNHRDGLARFLEDGRIDVNG